MKGGIDREKNIRADCREKKGRADYQGEEGVRWLQRDISCAIHQLEEITVEKRCAARQVNKGCAGKKKCAYYRTRED